eukprot:TRINITY_DN7739_c0_g1::TRINITY_DN7739_c0_g1_i1::g.8350::m.8350 TRINITY_DN7739_c0_g1::TRINITY_DN7739_c0_g1_i1::g.8350  ORF type:complete len:145 (-),score=-8.98,sp/Q66K94/SOSB1_XENTR/44.76/1e-23,tRNA_anti-codon/PF01336.20/0.069,ATP-synt_J/PF04911.7/0.092 TRINITY_DN7739_c0_g1_i1:341-775(-)
MARPQGKPTGDRDFTQIFDLRPGQKSVNVRFIVLEKGEKKRTKDGHMVAEALVADHSGCVQMSLWDDLIDQISPSEIFKLMGGRAVLFKNSLMLSMSKTSVLQRVGEFTLVFKEDVNMSSLQWIQDPKNPNMFHPVPPGTAPPS